MRITPRFSGEIAHIPYVPSGKETEEPKPVQRPSIAKAWERMLQEGIPVQPRHYFPEAQLDTMITEIEARHPNVKIVKEPHEDD